jgi:alkylhydroperoxidase family enzyme
MSESAATDSPTASLPFNDEELESKLVWIYGSPRSGSTWLLEMLCHPLSIELSPDSDLGFRWPQDWQGQARALPVDGLQISAHLAPAVFGHPGTTDTLNDGAGNILPRTLNRQAGLRGTYAFSPAYADVWRPHARRLTLARLHAIVGRARAAGLGLSPEMPVLAIKEVDDSHAADVVMSLFPRSRMIFLVRDGRDVLDSLLDANRAGGWLTAAGWGTGEFETADEKRKWIREQARNWVARMNVCERAYDAHDAALRRRTRYEDLLADTPARLGEIAKWLALPASPERIERIATTRSFAALPAEGKGPGKFRRAATPGGWRENLTHEEQGLMQEIMGPVLEALDYTR